MHFENASHVVNANLNIRPSVYAVVKLSRNWPERRSGGLSLLLAFHDVKLAFP